MEDRTLPAIFGLAMAVIVVTAAGAEGTSTAARRAQAVHYSRSAR